MKNVLFATTALAGLAFAGAAFADAHTGVALSGSAEMGVTYYDDGTNDVVQFHNDLDVTFTLSGATDNGLTFGATIDLDETDGGAILETANSVFISGAFGTLTMGDTDGAYDKVHIELPDGGLAAEADQQNGGAGLDGVSPEIARYDYTFGPITASASIALEDSNSPFIGSDSAGATANADLTSPVYGVGVAYSGDFGGASVGVGIGAQFAETDGPTLGTGDHTVIGVSAKVGFGMFGVQGTYQTFDQPAGTTDIYGGAATYDNGPIGFAVAYEHTDAAAGNSIDLIQGFVTYDLTGGAELVAAVSSVDNDALPDAVIRAGFGVGLSF